MTAYLRYALATTCFVLSVACLGLWGWASADRDFYWSYPLASEKVVVQSANGMVTLGKIPSFSRRSGIELYFFNVREEARFEKLGYPEGGDEKVGWFGAVGPFYYFPLWYPILVFTLAGIGALRLGRFTLRSALIATTVVAGLLGMAAAL
ncbi:hypothetical protein [Lacipirellula parvula]|uniref:Uncharacterized protein n=1 Tax=Lacipirellula parvula TaxID=2650471 RepID=A0A5K7X8E9_9BACT|nr:hypothetical protein [Lacipirellula parvula]BBO32910.1 hypothetical protein PLANPX_2522 [Lacipirellula parvula]